MKKQNLTTLAIFAFVMVFSIVFSAVQGAVEKKARIAEEASMSAEAESISRELESLTFEDETSSTTEGTTKEPETNEEGETIEQTDTTESTTTKPKGKFSMKDALFIGDSRTVGIAEYANISGAKFFCDVGMSSYNVYDKNLPVKSIGKTKLKALLKKHKFGKIYIMLGINEIGYDFTTTVKRYSELVKYIRKAQPEAVVFIQANMHVTAERSKNDKIVNNKRINRFNEAIKKMANNKTIYYLDVNPVFDDKSGALDSKKTGDNTHVYAKHYKEWGEWIVKQSKQLLGYTS